MAEIGVAADQRNSVIDADLSDEGIGQWRFLTSADEFRAEVSGPFPKTIEKGKKRQFFQDASDIRGKCGVAQEFGQDDRVGLRDGRLRAARLCDVRFFHSFDSR